MCLVILAILVRGVLPRYRIDQIISTNWKLFISVAISYILYLLMIFLLLK